MEAVRKDEIQGIFPPNETSSELEKEWPPSHSIGAITTRSVPGPPQDIRASCKRTPTTLKIRWKEPAVNPQCVCAYNVQMRRDRKAEKWNESLRVERKSCKFPDLSTKTVYLFRVQSINTKGVVGQWSNEVRAETRIGKFGRTLALTGAAVGATIGGPLLGAMIGVHGVSNMAGKNIDSEGKRKAVQISAGAGGAVAGALLGTVAAPFLGTMTALYVYRRMVGVGEGSPQTSDEEYSEPADRVTSFYNWLENNDQ